MTSARAVRAADQADYDRMVRYHRERTRLARAAALRQFWLAFEGVAWEDLERRAALEDLTWWAGVRHDHRRAQAQLDALTQEAQDLKLGY